MGEFKHPETEEAFHENFAQIKPLMNATMAYYESSRCLFCYDAPCITACPTGIDIPLFIRQINTGNLNGAARTIYASNYFGHICGKVCPTEVLCEGACVYNEQDVKPIEIGRLQSFATTNAMETGYQIHHPGDLNGKRVAVVGAGPAGIACACELSSFGYEVDLFEAREHPSGLALYGTAPYKITNDEVLDEVKYLQDQFGFNMLFNQRIETKAAFEKLEQEYDALFLGIGLGNTRPTNTPGENLGNCFGATEFIEELKLNPTETHVGKNVVVIGGGNTAMDAASESARMGAEEVTLIYRRSKEEMRAYGFEFDLAKLVGVQAIFNANVISIYGDENVERITCIQTKNADGKLETIPESEFELECDMLIRATGQLKMTSLLDLIGLDHDSRGRIIVDVSSYQCSNQKYFAGGDAVNGGAEVVNACAEGKKAAQGIHQFLS
jgi:glutamate synthase (NADPH/NADH) small chain